MDETSLNAHKPLIMLDDWIGVFQQRGVWHLTRDFIDTWVDRNSVFFGTLLRLVEPGSRVLELGCGPGRHALGAASLGYEVVGVDIDPKVVSQAQVNAHETGLVSRVEFRTGDMFNLSTAVQRNTFDAITHGGIMEHLESAESIRDFLWTQLEFAPVVVFDIPVDTPKNRSLFERDTIFRQLWTVKEWVGEVLAGLPVLESNVELHQQDNMTDDLVIALRA